MKTTRTSTPSRYPLESTLVLAAALVASATGCASTSSTAGMRLPTLSADERVDGALVPFQGVVRIDPQGRLTVEVTDPNGGGGGADRWAVWPEGAELILGSGPDAGTGAVVEGRRYVKGDPISGTGRLVTLEALPGGGKRGGYFRSSGTSCGALDAGGLVMDDVQPAGAAASLG